MKMYRGKMTCVPNGVTVNAADAKTSCYDEYDNYVSNAYRTPAVGPVVANDAGVWSNNETWVGPNLRREQLEEEEDDDEDDDGRTKWIEFLREATEEGACRRRSMARRTALNVQ